MAGISVFPARDRTFDRYLGDPLRPEEGQARIARMIGRHNSGSLSGGVVVYERVTVDWDLPFDEMITVIEGAMQVISGGQIHDLGRGDVARFPAHTPLTYCVADRVTVSYAVWPQPE